MSLTRDMIAKRLRDGVEDYVWQRGGEGVRSRQVEGLIASVADLLAEVFARIDEVSACTCLDGEPPCPSCQARP